MFGLNYYKYRSYPGLSCLDRVYIGIHLKYIPWTMHTVRALVDFVKFGAGWFPHILQGYFTGLGSTITPKAIICYKDIIHNWHMYNTSAGIRHLSLKIHSQDFLVELLYVCCGKRFSQVVVF